MCLPPNRKVRVIQDPHYSLHMLGVIDESQCPHGVRANPWELVRGQQDRTLTGSADRMDGRDLEAHLGRTPVLSSDLR